MDESAHIIHTHCQVAYGSRTIQNLSKSMSTLRTEVTRKELPRTKTRKPNKGYENIGVWRYSEAQSF